TSCIIFLYELASNFSLIQNTGPIPCMEKHPQTMIDPPLCFMVFIVYFGSNLVLAGLRTHCIPSELHKFIFVSSLNRTLYHFSAGQSTCSVAKAIRAALFFLEISGFLAGRLPIKPLLNNLL